MQNWRWTGWTCLGNSSIYSSIQAHYWTRTGSWPTSVSLRCLGVGFWNQVPTGYLWRWGGPGARKRENPQPFRSRGSEHDQDHKTRKPAVYPTGIAYQGSRDRRGADSMEVVGVPRISTHDRGRATPPLGDEPHHPSMEVRGAHPLTWGRDPLVVEFFDLWFRSEHHSLHSQVLARHVSECVKSRDEVWLGRSPVTVTGGGEVERLVVLEFVVVWTSKMPSEMAQQPLTENADVQVDDRRFKPLGAGNPSIPTRAERAEPARACRVLEMFQGSWRTMSPMKDEQMVGG